MKRILVLLLCVFLVNAFPTTITEILMHKYSVIECKVNATMGLLEDTAAYNNASDEANAQESALVKNLEELKMYAEQGNLSGFNAAVAGLQGKMRNAATTLRAVKQQIGKDDEAGGKGNGFGKAQMLRSYENARLNEAQCLRSVAPALARAELKEWKEWQEQKRERLRVLAMKNIAVGRINDILEAHNNTINRYNAVIDNSTAEELRALRTALVQEQYEIRARYEIEYMRVLLGAMNETASEKGYADEVAQISSLLESASQKTLEYEQEQFSDGWSELKKAAGLMRDLFNKIRG